MSDSYVTELYTGKSWERTFQIFSDTAMTTPRPFVTGESLRAQMRETPGGPVIATPTAAIVSAVDGTGKISLTDEVTAVIVTARQFGVAKIYWIDVDRISGTDIWPLMQIKVYVKAGVTQVVVVT